MPDVTRPVPLLEVRGLTKNFHVPGRGSRVLCALDKIDLDVARGETLGLVGESGCGKSTLARTLLMLEQPDEGTIRFDGTDPFTLSGKKLLAWRRRVQMVFQDPFASLNARMNAGEIISEPWMTHKDLYPTRKLRQERLGELLQLVGLRASDAGKSPQEFSGGQRQRIGIARALALNPDVIVLRRAGLGTRPVGAGAGAQPAQRVAAAPGGGLHLHLARPLGCPTRRRPGGGDVPGPHRRGRDDGGGLRPSPAPVHGSAHVSVAAARRLGNLSPAAHRARGRDTLAPRSAVGMPVPHALLEGAGNLCHRRAPAHRLSRQHHPCCRVPLPARARGDPGAARPGRRRPGGFGTELTRRQGHGYRAPSISCASYPSARLTPGEPC